MRKRILILISVLIVGSLLLSACGTPAVETVIVEIDGETVIQTVIVEAEAEEVMQPVTLNMNLGTEPPTLDPSLSTDTTSVWIQENIFVGLTIYNPVTNEVDPYLAPTWDIGEDADGNQTWTFYLRDDVPWVKYDPVTGETTQEVDADGNPRFVNAYDVEYGAKRTVDPHGVFLSRVASRGPSNAVSSRAVILDQDDGTCKTTSNAKRPQQTETAIGL